MQQGRLGDAIKSIRKAIGVIPDDPRYRGNLAMALFEAGKLDEALTAFRAAARLAPDEPQFAMGAANCLARLGDAAAAETELKKIVDAHPGFALAWLNLANAVSDQDRKIDAVKLYRRAIELDPQLVDAHNSLGATLLKMARFDEAEQAFRAALVLAPDYVPALSNLASVLIDRGVYPDAEATCRRILQLDPANVMGCLMLGSALGHQHRVTETIVAYRRAVELDPTNARALAGLGLALHETGDTPHALSYLQRAREIAPADPELPYSLSMVYLSLGRFAEGWLNYTARPVRRRFLERHPETPLDGLLPDNLQGKHVCVLREQGLGDEIFFLRFAGQLKARGASITYRANPKILSMLARVPCFERVVSQDDPVPAADHVVMVGDLPHLVGTDTAPPPLVLSPLADALHAQRQRLAEIGPPPYIGLTWRGGIAPEDQRGTFWGLFKQIGLDAFAEPLRGLHATLIALQRGPKDGEIAALSSAAGRPIHDLSPLNEDLESMLALLALLDDYIGVSNTNMHLRASVGRTARVLVPCPAEWRWMASGDSSPWFPGFKTYRQHLDGNWDAALGTLTADLRSAPQDRGKP